MTLALTPDDTSEECNEFTFHAEPGTSVWITVGSKSIHLFRRIDADGVVLSLFNLGEEADEPELKITLSI